MGKLYAEISVSLDGFVAGPNISPDNPLGEGGERLHDWVTSLASWKESHGQSGGRTGPDDELMKQSIARGGAVGKNMFGPGEGGPGDDGSWQGWWGDDPPFHQQVFVLTHTKREPLQLSDTTFTFVNDGLESALEQAREAAGDDEVQISGGANAIQQYLRGGQLDELFLHVAPILLGDGVRLFDNLGGVDSKLEPVEAIESPAVTHLRYRVSR